MISEYPLRREDGRTENRCLQIGNIHPSDDIVDRLRCLEVFTEVANGSSFSAAARRLGVSRGTVTKHVAQLERTLGAQLFARTTKKVNLTQAGHALLDEGQGFMQQFDRMEEAVRESVSAERGQIHIGSPPSFAEVHLMPLICGFLRKHPEIDVKLHLDYNKEDIVAEGLDLTLRVTPALKASSMVAQRLTSVPQVLVASPQYLEACGDPTVPADLARHSCLVHLLKSPNRVWSFNGPNGRESIKVGGKISANFGEVLQQAALMHQGISMHPAYMVAPDLHQRRLNMVLPEYDPGRLDVYVLYPSRANVPARVRRFIEHMKDSF
jgi:DNA-binding transcriptional LysR family regulator